ncbi:L-aspartate oxidase [Marininema halotolerans]|uniref:L-aspartate oxidase n=1 Tax=Marininema halotolerans TaxID=1155944 RepID=A0A1I6Q2C8_9BACL|nr:L-aspartate oxidase [Marininema halotolerans]SFS46490.1 L-aspartate oxidase [Marininema halotolerans]
MNRITTDYLVVGSGIAGLTAALTLATKGRVTVLSKTVLNDGNSARAQGGIAAAVGKDDSPSLHREDTLRAGAGLCEEDSVNVLVKNGADAVRQLDAWGTPFDSGRDGWNLGREGSHSVHRILHVSGDATGAAIMDALLQRAEEHPRIRLLGNTRAVDLVVEEGECIGVSAFYAGKAVLFLARAVILATGGCGQIYRYTTNSPAVTGDGIAMAWRAGAQLRDMEFVQFHPTALAIDANPMFLISEAVRGEGAFLVNDKGDAFMSRVHEWGDLAPRDVVSRAIDSQMRAGRKVYLDATCLGEAFATRFPTIYEHCRKAGIDPSVDWIPVTPATHFVMGGVWTDTFGRSSIPRLFAVGEAACTGVHGANRLASNSLLEGTVYAQRAAQEALTLSAPTILPKRYSMPICSRDEGKEKIWKDELRLLMWEHAGIIRDKEGLQKGLEKLTRLERKVPVTFLECRDMITISRTVMESALWREESRGGHYRKDYPQSSAQWATTRSLMQRGRQDESIVVAGDCT